MKDHKLSLPRCNLTRFVFYSNCTDDFRLDIQFLNLQAQFECIRISLYIHSIPSPCTLPLRPLFIPSNFTFRSPIKLPNTSIPQILVPVITPLTFNRGFVWSLLTSRLRPYCLRR